VGRGGRAPPTTHEDRSPVDRPVGAQTKSAYKFLNVLSLWRKDPLYLWQPPARPTAAFVNQRRKSVRITWRNPDISRQLPSFIGELTCVRTNACVSRQKLSDFLMIFSAAKGHPTSDTNRPWGRSWMSFCWMKLPAADWSYGRAPIQPALVVTIEKLRYLGHVPPSVRHRASYADVTFLPLKNYPNGVNWFILFR